MQMLKRTIRKVITTSLPLARAIDPVLRLHGQPEIVLNTHYPGCVIRVANRSGQWEVNLTNGDPSKISTEAIQQFFEALVQDRLPASARIRLGRRIDFRLNSVCLENWRDIWDGRIQDLIEDETSDYTTERVGAFGYLAGDTKPYRLRFYELAKTHPEMFEYIETDKYSGQMSRSINLLGFKEKFKYVIDLPGHTYSTKIYWMLFLGRPVFYVEPIMKFRWEQKLKPWVHYIPVRRDYSDLVDRYCWAENNPEKVQALCNNMIDFGRNEMSPSHVINHLVLQLEKVIGKWSQSGA